MPRRIRDNLWWIHERKGDSYVSLGFVKSHYVTARKFKNESKAILALLVALSSECTGVYHALGNRLRLSATRLER